MSMNCLQTANCFVIPIVQGFECPAEQGQVCQADLRNPHFGYQAFDNFGMNSLTVFQVCPDEPPPITLLTRPSRQQAGSGSPPCVYLRSRSSKTAGHRSLWGLVHRRS